ncbi:MAG TPA: GNAT family N-acetyltransferase [Acidobacteriaceae bacterium]|nr:GNAT family N-acetyltransferase [Acidobacteriaceae bacterium]
MLTIRKANAADTPLMVEMIRELAEFEHELEQVDATAEDLLRDGFGTNPLFHALVAEWDGQPAGYALYFFTYSTWAGRPGLFVEDLFVRSQFRGKGIGKALLRHMAVIGRDQNCYGMRWEVLNWNTRAIGFYRSLGVKVQDEWLQVLFMGKAFEEFGARERRG